MEGIKTIQIDTWLQVIHVHTHMLDLLSAQMENCYKVISKDLWARENFLGQRLFTDIEHIIERKFLKYSG